MGFISRPFGLFLFWLNNFFGNYGLALIFFTLAVRLILLPLSFKQQKSMQDTQKIQPELLKIREKYKNDKQKLNEETMKLYQKHGINPAGGCFPLLIQFPIIIGLYQAIIKPLTYMFGMLPEQVTVLTEKVNEVLVSKGLDAIGDVGRFEIPIAQNLKYLSADVLESVGLANVKLINFNFLGLDLGQTPSLNYITLLWIIPVLAALTTFLSTKVTSTSNAASTEANSAASTMKTMNALFPLMTAWFTFSMPAGVGFYWILGNIIQIIQQFFLNRYFAAQQQDSKPALEKKKS
ncbi:MAG: YidC/Oxa1 family membrane protein insertase [Clostridiaceae bacterium]|nr:YidC/Oxa1 family membrane protein insertase [Clostridiaceae bacterium]